MQWAGTEMTAVAAEHQPGRGVARSSDAGLAKAIREGGRRTDG